MFSEEQTRDYRKYDMAFPLDKTTTPPTTPTNTHSPLLRPPVAASGDILSCGVAPPPRPAAARVTLSSQSDGGPLTFDLSAGRGGRGGGQAGVFVEGWGVVAEPTADSILRASLPTFNCKFLGCSIRIFFGSIPVFRVAIPLV